MSQIHTMHTSEELVHCCLCRQTSTIAAEIAASPNRGCISNSQDKEFREEKSAALSSSPSGKAIKDNVKNGRLCALELGLQTTYLAVMATVLILVPSAGAFNVDVQKAIIHTGENGSMFGYSVTQHIDQSTNW